jgi:hypothetical protein
MLRRLFGASTQELVDAIGWKAKSVHGAVSGEMRRRRLMEIPSEVVKLRSGLDTGAACGGQGLWAS